jgi:regulator of sigma E protease
MLQKILYVAEVVLGFGGLIFVHELGHFLAAKANGVKVLRFAVGFDFWGLRLFRKQIGETEYVIGAFPLGGYVKMLGQEDLPADGQESEAVPEGHFLSRTIGQRAQIISAGVIANFLLAFVLCYGAYLVGYHRYLPEVGSVGFDSLQSGLRRGDVIESVDGDRVDSWTEMFMAYAMQEPGEDVEMVVLRGGPRVTLQLPVMRDPNEPINVPDFERAIGLQIAGILEESPASRAGLQGGDTLVSVDGVELTSWSHFSSIVRRLAGETIQLTVDRLDEDGDPGERRVLEMTLDESDDPFAPMRGVGIGPGQPPVIDAVLDDSPAAAAGLEAGDRIVAVAGQPTASWREAWLAIEFATAGEPLAITVERADRQLVFEVVPLASQHWAIGMWGLPVIGAVHRAPEDIVVGHLDPDGSAAAGGLQTGDVIEALVVKDPETGEDTTIELYSWNHLYANFADDSMDGAWVRIEFLRDGTSMSKSVEVGPDPSGRRRGMVGVFGNLKQERIQLGPIEAIWPSIEKPFVLFDEFVKGFRAMFMGRVSPKTIAGPVGILSVTYSAAEQGLGDLLLLLALISVNLAIVNFLPIPITDGGHVLFLLYEKVRGRRMSEDVQGKLVWAGLLFLLLVFVFVTWNDLVRVFTG